MVSLLQGCSPSLGPAHFCFPGKPIAQDRWDPAPEREQLGESGPWTAAPAGVRMGTGGCLMLTGHHILGQMVSAAMSWAGDISPVQHPGLSIHLMVPLP